jgi:hypothetical protein
MKRSTVAAIELALKLPAGGLAQLRSGEVAPDEFPLHRVIRRQGRSEDVILYNASFKGDPLSPRMACKIVMALDMFVDAWQSLHRDAVIRGSESAWDEAPLFCELPLMVHSRVNLAWYDRMIETAAFLSKELNRGSVPTQRNVAESVILWCAIQDAATIDVDTDDDGLSDMKIMDEYDVYPEVDSDFGLIEELLFEDHDFEWLFADDQGLRRLAESKLATNSPQNWWITEWYGADPLAGIGAGQLPKADEQ